MLAFPIPTHLRPPVALSTPGPELGWVPGTHAERGEGSGAATVLGHYWPGQRCGAGEGPTADELSDGWSRCRVLGGCQSHLEVA